jgi:large subunit ribosomal protein L10
LNRTQKEGVVAQLEVSLRESQATFVTDFKGLTVSQISGLRRKIGEAGGQYQVAKNTLVKLAAKGTGAEALSEMLVGNNALGTTTGDPVALAKALVEFAKGQEKFSIKGGVLKDKTVTYEQIKALADLPSRDVLLATLLGTMNAVPSSFVRVLAAVPQNFLYALSAIREQKEAQVG